MIHDAGLAPVSDEASPFLNHFSNSHSPVSHENGQAIKQMTLRECVAAEFCRYDGNRWRQQQQNPEAPSPPERLDSRGENACEQSQSHVEEDPAAGTGPGFHGAEERVIVEIDRTNGLLKEATVGGSLVHLLSQNRQPWNHR